MKAMKTKHLVELEEACVGNSMLAHASQHQEGATARFLRAPETLAQPHEARALVTAPTSGQLCGKCKSTVFISYRRADEEVRIG